MSLQRQNGPLQKAFNACAGAIWWFLQKVWSVLWGDKVPLIINVALICATAYVTYVFAPQLNGVFERQKIQSSYILENLRYINQNISDLYVDVGQINYALAAGDDVPSENISSARETINRLNWKIIETAAILDRDSDVDRLDQFSASLDQVRVALDNTDDVESARVLSERVRDMSLLGVEVIAVIGDRASLNPEVDPSGREGSPRDQ